MEDKERIKRLRLEEKEEKRRRKEEKDRRMVEKIFVGSIENKRRGREREREFRVLHLDLALNEDYLPRTQFLAKV